MKNKFSCRLRLIIACTLFSSATFAVCDNVTSSGTVAGNQSTCGSYNPSNITNLVYPAGGTGTLQYQWQNSPNGTVWTDIAGATLESYDPATISATTYYHRLERRSSCTVYAGTSNTITKTVLPLPVASISAGGAITFCSPGSVTLTATTGNGYVYQWKKNNVAISGATTNVYVANATGSYTITVTLASCSATSNAISVNVQTPLTTTITEAGFSVCQGSTAMLQVQSGAGFSYKWFENSDSIPGVNSYELVTGHNGIYSCTITNLCGSYASAPYTLNNFMLSMSPYGTIVANGSTTICNGGNVNLSLDPNYWWWNFYGYQWYKDGSPIAGANSSSYTATQSGHYTLRLTDYCIWQGFYYDFYTNVITVTNSGGTYPTPSITAGGATSFCSGGNVVLTEATGVGWTYQWRNNAANISGATTSTYNATSSGTYTCAVTNACGTVVSNSIVVSVIPNTVSVSAGSATTFCSGLTVTLTASTAGTGGTYQWKLNGTSIGGATGSTYIASGAGSYTCSITNTCGTFTSAAVVVTILANCNTGLRFDGTNDYVRVPNNAAYSFGTGNFTIEAWVNLDATQSFYPTLVSNRTNQAGTGFWIYFNNGKLRANLFGVDQGGSGPDLRDNVCHHVAVVRSSSTALSFYVDGSLVSTGSSTTGNVTTAYPVMIGNDNFYLAQNYCAMKGRIMEVRMWNVVRTQTDLQSSMGNSLTGNETGLKGYWRLNDGAGQVANDLTVTNNDGQLGSTTASDVNDPAFSPTCPLCAPPAATITAGGATTFCTGGSVVLTSTTGGGWTYQWRNNGTNITGATSSSYTANASGAYTCVVTSSCGSTTTNSITVTVTTGPAASITAGGATTFCTGSNVVLSANTGPGLTYQWKLNGTNINGATSSTYTATASGSFTCVVTNTCGSTTSNAIIVTVNTAPSATITAGGTTTICAGTFLTLSANSGNGYTYQWKLNGSNIAGATTSSYSAGSAGSYTCVVNNTCGNATSNAIVITISANCTTGLQYDGVNDYARIPNSASYAFGLNDFTVEGWINMETVQSAGNYPSMISHRLSGNGFSGFLIYFSAGKLTAQLGGSNNPAFGPDLRDNACHHVAVTRTGAATVSFYVDGVLVGTNPNGNHSVDAADYFLIGNDLYDNLNDGFKGKIMEVRLWNLARSAAQIQGAMNAQLAGNETGLVGYWRLNDGNGQLVNDNSNTNNDGQLGSTTNSDANDPVFASACSLCTAPVVTISAGGSTTFCTGGSVVLNSNTGNGWTFQWKKNGTNITGATSSSYTATTAGSYTCTATNSCGTNTSSAIVVTVNTVPAASISSSTTSLCAGGSIALTANTGNGLTYQWKLNGASISAATSSTYNATATGSYTCVVTNACGSTTSNTIAIVAGPAVPATPGSISGLAKPCPGANGVAYSISAVSGATTYTWTAPTNASIASGQGTTNVIVNFTSAYRTGNISVTAGNSCGTSAAKTKSLTNNLPSTPSTITGQTTNLCGGVTTSYSISSVNAAPTNTWTVPVGASVVSGQGTTTVSVHFPNNFSTGTISVVGSNSCGSSTARTLTVNGTPARPASISGTTVPCANMNYVYSVTAVSGATSYTWTVPTGASVISGQGSTSATVHFGSSSGTVKVVSVNNCGSSSSRNLSVVISCRETNPDPEENFETTVYPNPSSSTFEFSVSGTPDTFTEINISDLTGRILETYSGFFDDKVIQCGGRLANGIYLAEIRSGSARKVIRLIKQE